MKFLKRLKSSNFWVSMISAVVLILQAVFNIEIKAEYLNQIIMAILGLLVMSGIVSDGSNDEITVSKGVDIDTIKEVVENVLNGVALKVETDLVDIVKQLEKTETNNQNKEQSLEKSFVENVALVEDIVKIDENQNTQNENITSNQENVQQNKGNVIQNPQEVVSQTEETKVQTTLTKTIHHEL